MSQPLTKDPAAFAETRIDDEIVIMNLASGDFFSLTDSAAAIWDLLDGSRDRAAVLAALATNSTSRRVNWRAIWIPSSANCASAV